jgi:hypothetical protein
MMEDLLPVVEERQGSFPIWGIVGPKGTAKTYTYVTFPYETGLAFSMDGKVRRILNQFPERKPHWRVIDALAYYDMSETRITETAARTHDYWLQVLRRYDPDPTVRATIPPGERRAPVDVVVIDGLEALAEVEEMRMRFRHRVGPFEGFSNRGFWKTRRLGSREIVRAACRAATKAFVFTTYPQRIEEYKDGVLINTKSPPNWFDLFEKETDMLLQTEREETVKEGTQFYVSIVTSKFPSFPTGKKYRVTGTSFTEAIGREAFFDLTQIEPPPLTASDLVAAASPTVSFPPAAVRTVAAEDEGSDLDSFLGG